MSASFTSVTSSTGYAAPRAVRVGDLLLERGLITQDQLNHALAHQKTRGHAQLLGEVLIELEFVTEEHVMAVLAEAYGVPFARITPKVADSAVTELLPREFLEKQCVLPLFLVGGRLTLAMHEPANVFLIEEVERITGHSVQIVAATARDIQNTLQNHSPNANVFVIDELVEDLKHDELSLVEQQITELADSEGAADDSPIIKLVNYLIYTAVQDAASDIHIEPGDQELRIRFRVDGRLHEQMTPPYKMHPALVSRIKIMAGLDISERRLPQDGGICIMINKRQIDLRVSTMPGKFGEKVVVRIIDKHKAMTSLESLGFSEAMLKQYRTVARQPNGIVLVTGPTGSGKSSTLYATLNEINDDAINITTVEDPVEHNIPGVNQFQVNERVGFTFPTALRALLRQDPDIIMVGEIRDEETARIATQAALTGHLVYATLHTNDAPSAVTRLFNIGVQPYLIAASIRAVLAQRLVRRICTHCRETTEITAQQRHIIERMAPEVEVPQTLQHGMGCAKCRKTGYAGRLGIYELYVPSAESLDAISRGATLQELRALAENDGCKPLKHDGLEKVCAGLTTLDELVTATAV